MPYCDLINSFFTFGTSVNLSIGLMYSDNQLNDNGQSGMLNYSHVACTDVGLVRTINEDIYLHESTVNGELFIVCDGMGGHSRGRLAAKTASEQIHAIMQQQFFEDVRLSLRTAIAYANQEIANLNHNKIEFKRMGTTVVVALIRGNQLFYAHVGDSRLYLLRESKLYQLTQDHTYVQQLVDGGIITQKEAKNHPKRNQLTQAIGINYEVIPTVSESAIECFPNDLFFICTDGITEMLDDNELLETLEKELSLKEKAEMLIEVAKEKGGEDNLTAMLIRINESEW